MNAHMNTLTCANDDDTQQVFSLSLMFFILITPDEIPALAIFVPLQLPVCTDTADLPAPSAGDAGDLQFGRPDTVGQSHPWRGVRPLPQPDYSQEKGHKLLFFF